LPDELLAEIDIPRVMSGTLGVLESETDRGGFGVAEEDLGARLGVRGRGMRAPFRGVQRLPRRAALIAERSIRDSNTGPRCISVPEEPRPRQALAISTPTPTPPTIACRGGSSCESGASVGPRVRLSDAGQARDDSAAASADNHGVPCCQDYALVIGVHDTSARAIKPAVAAYQLGTDASHHFACSASCQLVAYRSRHANTVAASNRPADRLPCPFDAMGVRDGDDGRSIVLLGMHAQ
jgi:hypothetical protein